VVEVAVKGAKRIMDYENGLVRERSGLTEDDSSISALRISLSLSLFLCLLQKIKSKLHYNN